MALTRITDNLIPTQWESQFFNEYVQENPFATYMGDSENDIIQVKSNLTKGKGDKIVFPLVNKSQGPWLTGYTPIMGNQEQLVTRSWEIEIDVYAKGIEHFKFEDFKSVIDLANAKKSVLKTASMEHTRDKIITALGSINGVAYASASEAQKDAWLVDNADRVVFGQAAAGYTDHSADLALLDTTSDKLSAAVLDDMRIKAVTAGPKVRPVDIAEMGRRYWVAFAHPRAVRDLRRDTSILNSLQYTTQANQNNRLFKGGDVEWNGIIVHEVDDLPIYENVGANGTTDVAPVYLVGAQAIGVAFGQRWKPLFDEYDHGRFMSAAIEAIYEVGKMRFGTGATDTDDPVDHGVVTGYVAVT